MKKEEPEPKPYQLVSFPKEPLSRNTPAGHARARDLHHTGWMDVEFVTLTPLQVATGITDFVKAGDGEQLALSQFSVDRYADDDSGEMRVKAVLPGSSIKGTIRSLFEAISPSCLLTVGKPTRSAAPKRLAGCANANSLCPACRLFGAQDYQGQVSFADAEAPENSLSLVGTPLLWTPARSDGRGLPPRYLTRGEAKGRKVYEHRKPASGPDPRLVIREGAAIPFRLSFTNLTDGDLGVLLAALGQHPNYPFFIKLGAGKPVGLGTVEVKITRAVLIGGGEAIKMAGRLGKAEERAEKLEGPALQTRIAEWAKKASEKKLLLEDRLKEVAQTLRRENLNQPAPTGLY